MDGSYEEPTYGCGAAPPSEKIVMVSEVKSGKEEHRNGFKRGRLSSYRGVTNLAILDNDVSSSSSYVSSDETRKYVKYENPNTGRDPPSFPSQPGYPSDGESLWYFGDEEFSRSRSISLPVEDEIPDGSVLEIGDRSIPTTASPTGSETPNYEPMCRGTHHTRQRSEQPAPLARENPNYITLTRCACFFVVLFVGGAFCVLAGVLIGVILKIHHLNPAMGVSQHLQQSINTSMAQVNLVNHSVVLIPE